MMEYKVTEYNFNGVKVIVYDPSSDEARKPVLEEACRKFMIAVTKQRMAANANKESLVD